MARRKSHRSRNVFLTLVVTLLVVIVCLALFRVGEPATISIEPGLPGIGKKTPVTVTAEESSRGLGDVRVEFVQGERVEVLAEQQNEPRAFWKFWGPRTSSNSFMLEVGRETQKGLKEGEATIRVTVERAGTWFRGPDPNVKELTLPVRLVPPSLQVASSAIYVAQGGCEAVVYRVGPTSVRDGVRAGDWFFPGFPLPGGDERDRFALFAVPYDVDDESKVRLIAADDVENEATVSFISQFFPKPVKRDTIRLSDAFMERVVPAIMSRTPEIEDRGSLLENYLAVNGELRKVNAETLVGLAARSRQEFLWSRPFQQMRNAQVMSAFADRRSYVYEGRKVDQQDHLGFDLASTQRAPVPAANDGLVLMARYFGIYGNTVVIDHGYGLMTLYGHLSSIAVEEGQVVTRGDEIGRTGATGLAGGDHLHYTTMLQGLPVTPVEWWDGHWIRDRIASKLGSAFSFER